MLGRLAIQLSLSLQLLQARELSFELGALCLVFLQVLIQEFVLIAVLRVGVSGQPWREKLLFQNPILVFSAVEGKPERVKETYLDIVRKKWYFLPNRPRCFLHFLLHNYTRTHRQAHKE